MKTSHFIYDTKTAHLLVVCGKTFCMIENVENPHVNLNCVGRSTLGSDVVKFIFEWNLISNTVTILPKNI